MEESCELNRQLHARLTDEEKVVLSISYPKSAWPFARIYEGIAPDTVEISTVVSTEAHSE